MPYFSSYNLLSNWTALSVVIQLLRGTVALREDLTVMSEAAFLSTFSSLQLCLTPIVFIFFQTDALKGKGWVCFHLWHLPSSHVRVFPWSWGLPGLLCLCKFAVFGIASGPEHVLGVNERLKSSHYLTFILNTESVLPQTLKPRWDWWLFVLSIHLFFSPLILTPVLGWMRLYAFTSYLRSSSAFYSNI